MLEVESRYYKLTGISPILGSSPASKEIREMYVTSKAPTTEDMEVENKINQYDSDEKGVTVFNRNEDDELCLMGYQVKGFFKTAFTATKKQMKVANCNSKVDTLLHIDPRFIPIMREGEILMDKDQMLERPLRAMTMQGPRVSLLSSEAINNWYIYIKITLIPNAGTAKSSPITWQEIEDTLDYGQFSGLGQWRNAAFGRFTWRQIEENEMYM